MYKMRVNMYICIRYLTFIHIYIIIGFIKGGGDFLEENNYVVKANQFIQAKGKLTTLEQKLLAALISEIRQEDEDFKEYHLNIKEVSEFIGLNNKAIYERLSDVALGLLDKKLFLEEIDEKGRRGFFATTLISSAKHKENTGIITMKFDPDLKPYLLAIKGEETPFTKYMIKNILKLNGSYAIRLYEILKQWERVRVKKFETQHLKEMLGAEAESYNLFAEFERVVLKPAKKEVNEHTDLFVVYRKIKTGRRISHIEFEIETRAGYYDPTEDEHREYEKEGLFDYEFIKINSGMSNEKFSREQINKIYELAIERTSQYGVDELAYIKMNYEYAKERAKTGLYGYVEKAVRLDYAKAILKLAQIEM